MNLSFRNKKVAEIRWKKYHNVEEEYIHKNNDLNIKASLCGFIAGDGCINQRKSGKYTYYELRMFPDHLSLVEKLSKDFLQVYNKRPSLKRLNNFYLMRVYSQKVILDLLSYSLFGVKKWIIPPFVFNDLNFKKEWIKSFFDAEAYVNNNYIKVHSINKEGLIQVQNILNNDFEIKSHVYTYFPKEKTYNLQYSLLIMKKTFRIKYANLIGFNHLSKMDKLLNSIL